VAGTVIKADPCIVRTYNAYGFGLHATSRESAIEVCSDVPQLRRPPTTDGNYPSSGEHWLLGPISFAAHGDLYLLFVSGKRRRSAWMLLRFFFGALQGASQVKLSPFTSASSRVVSPYQRGIDGLAFGLCVV
jgi:hypothetical protein